MDSTFKRNAQTKRKSFEKNLLFSKRKPNLIQTDRGKDFHNSIFQICLNNKSIKHYSRKSSLGAVFAERCNRTLRDLLKQTVIEKRDGSWIDILPTKTKQYNKRIHTTNNIKPIQSSVKNNEGYVYNILIEKRKKIKPRFQVNDLVRTAHLKKTFSNGDTTNWFYNL